jgi:hypothetical protein
VKRDPIVMSDVTEYVAGRDVALCTLHPDDDNNLDEPRLVLRTFGQKDCNDTCVDLRELIAWLYANRPRLLREGVPFTRSDIMHLMQNDTLVPVEAVIVCVFLQRPLPTAENLAERTDRFVRALDLMGCTATPGRVLIDNTETPTVHLEGWTFTWRNSQEPEVTTR